MLENLLIIDPKIQLIQRKLQENQLENSIEIDEKSFDFAQKITMLSQHFSGILSVLGMNLSDPENTKTPNRLANLWLNELFYGLNYQRFPKISLMKNQLKNNEPIFIKNIHLMSFCEHHFLPILGKVIIAYIPNDFLLGFSKFNQLVDFFAKRPQIQERLTQQLLFAFQILLETENVGIFIEATHFCVKARDFRDDNLIETFAFGGNFQINEDFRREFLFACKK